MTAPNNNTPAAIIEEAMLQAGLIQEGQSPNSEQLAVGMRRLTDLINLEQTQGIKLWLNVLTNVTLVTGQATYVFGPSGDVVMAKPLRCIQAEYVTGVGTTSENKRPLTPLSWDDYLRLSLTLQQGTLNSYFVNKKETTLSISFWLVPDATAAAGIVQALLQVQVTNFTSVTETMNFPIEWKLFLVWGLADQLATGQPATIMDRCQQRAEAYRQKLEDWDVEDTPTQFTPDSRAQYSSGKFR